jgi:hypothetical protein
MNFLLAVLLSLFLHFLLLSWWWLGGRQATVQHAPTVLQVTVLQQPSAPEDDEKAKKIAEADQAAGGQIAENRLTAVRTVTTPPVRRNFLEELSRYTEMPLPSPAAAEPLPEALPEPAPPSTTDVTAALRHSEDLAREVFAAEIAAREAAAEAARAQAEARYLQRWFQEIQRIGNMESSRRGLTFTGAARVRFRILPNGRAQQISITFISGGSLEITEIIKTTIAQIQMPYPKTLTSPQYQEGLWVDKIWEFSK